MSHPQADDAVWDDDLRKLDSWIEEVYSLQPRRVTSTPIAKAILQRDAASAVAMIRAYVVKLELLDREHSLANQLLKRELPFSEDDLVWLALLRRRPRRPVAQGIDLDVPGAGRPAAEADADGADAGVPAQNSIWQALC